jgi:hypothetical protein
MNSGETRRRLLLLSGAAALVTGFQLAPRLAGSRELSFRPVPGLPGFRMLDGGSATMPSASDVLFFGLEVDPVETVSPAPTRAGLCDALFGLAAKAPLPVAFFSDPYCPNCRALEARLPDLGRNAVVTTHQVPVLGPASEAASRALLAARTMGLGKAWPGASRGRGWFRTPGS